MNHRLRYLVPACAALMLTACGSPGISQYAGTKPEITVQQFYSKPVAGYGFFQDKSGNVTDRYYVTLIPEWKGNEGTLTEKQWNDKGQLFFHQTWKIHVAPNAHDFTATATMVDGEVKGEASGYALHMTYTLLSPREDGSTISLAADDWTYLQPDGTGINKVALHKYGYHVGDVIYTLHALPRGVKPHEGYRTK